MDSEPSTHPMKKWWLTYSRGISFPERGLSPPYATLKIPD